MTAFESDYAQLYDLFYQDKDYAVECDFLEEIFKRYGEGPIRSILDLGCGTGKHALEMACRGYRLTGIDASEAMIAAARRKAETFDSAEESDWQVGRMEAFSLERKFDAVICMFNAINYVSTIEDLDSTMANVRRHLNPSGLFIFDFRNGIPSVRSYTPVNVKWFSNDQEKVMRISETRLDAMAQFHNTKYSCLVFKGENPVRLIEDHHHVRFSYPSEIKYFLGKNKFHILSMSRFLDLDTSADEDEWNIVVVAKAAPM